LKQKKRKARTSVDTMRNNLDGDVIKSYICMVMSNKKKIGIFSKRLAYKFMIWCI